MSAPSQVAVRRGSITTILRAARLFRRQQALVEHRVAPREVRADQHDKVGLVEVLVGAGNGVGAKGAFVPATVEAMQSRELVSILAEPMKPFISLLAT
jgi:hypothetical protein